MDKKYILGIDPDIANGEVDTHADDSEEGGGSSGGSSGGGTKTIRVFDADKFIANLEALKKKLRKTYVESEVAGATIYRYIDYASLMSIAQNSIIEVSIKDSEFTVHETPEDILLEHEFIVSGSEVESDIVMVGDSRTICMFSSDSEETISGEVHDGIRVYAGWGEGYDFLVESLEAAEEFTTLVVWLGCNDAAKGGSFAGTYGALYDSLLEEGKQIVIANVGRTDDKYLAPGDEGYVNSNMIAYNEQIAAWASEKEGVTFVDAYKASINWQLNKEDGIHYTPRPTTGIWQLITSCIPASTVAGPKKRMKSKISKPILQMDDPNGASGGPTNNDDEGEDGESGSGDGEGDDSGSSGSEQKSIKVIDADTFINSMEEFKKEFRKTYVESDVAGATLFRYIDFAHLMDILQKSSNDVQMSDDEFTIDDVPKEMLLEHTFDINGFAENNHGVSGGSDDEDDETKPPHVKPSDDPNPHPEIEQEV